MCCYELVLQTSGLLSAVTCEYVTVHDTMLRRTFGPKGKEVSIPAAALSKASVYGRSFAVIAGSNPAGGMDFCLL